LNHNVCIFTLYLTLVASPRTLDLGLRALASAKIFASISAVGVRFCKYETWLDMVSIRRTLFFLHQANQANRRGLRQGKGVRWGTAVMKLQVREDANAGPKLMGFSNSQRKSKYLMGRSGICTFWHRQVRNHYRVTISKAALLGR
jgi:hypothetical protein